MNHLYFWLTFIGIFDLLATLSARYWSATKNPWFMVATVVFFSLAGVFFAFSLQFKEVAIANIFWISISILTVTIAGYFLFHEPITALQAIGMAILVIGLIIVNL